MVTARESRRMSRLLLTVSGRGRQLVESVQNETVDAGSWRGWQDRRDLAKKHEAGLAGAMSRDRSTPYEIQ
jgi:ABC-type antimicrobial peptide transport system ATPase subunit